MGRLAARHMPLWGRGRDCCVIVAAAAPRCLLSHVVANRVESERESDREMAGSSGRDLAGAVAHSTEGTRLYIRPCFVFSSLRYLTGDAALPAPRPASWRVARAAAAAAALRRGRRVRQSADRASSQG